MTRPPSRTPLLSVLSLTIAVAVAGCGSSNDDSPSDLQNDLSRPGTTTPPGGTILPGDTTTPGTTTPPGGTTTSPDGTTSPDDTAEPDDMAEPGDTGEPDDTTEPDDMAEPDDTTEPDDMAEPGDTGEPGDTTSPDDTGEPDDTTEPGGTTEPDGVTTLPDVIGNRLERVLGIANGDALEAAVAVAGRGLESVAGVVSTGETFSPSAGANIPAFRCANGGTATRFVLSLSGAGLRVETDYEDCAIGAIIADGNVVQEPELDRTNGLPPPPYVGAGIGSPYTVTDFAYSDTRSNRSYRVSGTVGYSISGIGPDGGAQNSFGIGWTVPSQTVVDRFGSATATNLATRTSYVQSGGMGEPFATTFTTAFAAQLGGTDGSVVVSTPQLFERASASGNYTEGSLRIVGNDYDYTLDAANGDPSTFQLTVTQGGSVVSYVIPWSDRFDFDAFRPLDLDLGI